MDTSTFQTKVGLAEMLKGGVIMDVVNAEQARIAEDAGACAVMALERVPAQIRKDGGVARASDPAMIKSIQEAVSSPSWPSAVSDISWKLASSRRWKSISSMKAKC